MTKAVKDWLFALSERFFIVDLKVRGLLWLIFVVFAVLEALGVVNFRLQDEWNKRTAAKKRSRTAYDTCSRLLLRNAIVNRSFNRKNLFSQTVTGEVQPIRLLYHAAASIISRVVPEGDHIAVSLY